METNEISITEHDTKRPPDSITHWVLSGDGCVVESSTSDDGGKTWHNTIDLYGGIGPAMSGCQKGKKLDV